MEQIACGERHTIIKGDNGNVYGFGDNTNGQIDGTILGHNFVIDRPRIIRNIDKFKVNL